MGFVFVGVTEASISLAVVYFFMSLYIGYQLYLLHYYHNSKIELLSVTTPARRMQEAVNVNTQSHASPRSSLNTRKLFVMTCFLGCLLRLMSFTSMAILDLQAIHYSIDIVGHEKKFDDDLTGKLVWYCAG